MGYRIRRNAANGDPYWVEATRGDRLDASGFVESCPTREFAQGIIDGLLDASDLITEDPDDLIWDDDEEVQS